jgi:hypothetical protein
VWLRGARTWRGILVLKSRPHPDPQLVLIDRDLGRLLERCPAVLVSLGAGVAIVPAEQLIRVRALQVVAGLPYTSTYTQSVQALCALFPDLRGSAAGLEIPLRQRSAEEVLAACAAAGTPILRSRVVYGSLDAG